MKKRLTCIACPQSCLLEAEVEDNRVRSISGNKCPQGEIYARQEIENPLRVLTTTVRSPGLEVKLIPVRTDRPLPKHRLQEAIQAAHKIKITRPVRAGDVLADNFLSLQVKLIATRTAK